MKAHLTYANVTATIALLLAASTGGAYAINEIGSREIKDDSIRSKDLRDGKAVRGRDVKPNTLGGREIDEASLVGSRFISMGGSEAGNCDPTGSTHEACATATLKLKRASRMLVTATGGFVNASGGVTGASATCEVRIDDVPAFTVVRPGDLSGSTSTTATDGFARTEVTPIIPAGDREVSLACTEVQGDAIIGSPTIAVIAVTASK